MTLASFSRQTADLLKGGVPLLRALALVRAQSRGAWAAAISAVHDDLLSGKSLAAALGAHGLFPAYYVGIVRTAEEAGGLESAFQDLARHLSADEDAERRFRRALAYPVSVLALSVVVCGFLIAVVLPRFQDFFSELHQTLPWPTRVLLSAASAGRLAVPALAAVTAAFLVRNRAGGSVMRTPAWARRATDWLTAERRAARWARQMAALLKGGSTVMDALAALRPSTPAGWDRLAAAVAEGRPLSDGLRAARFPPLLVDIVAAGEDASALEDALERAALTLQRQADDRLSAWIAVMEPALLFAMAAGVGFVALALTLPIFDMSAGVR